MNELTRLNLFIPYFFLSVLRHSIVEFSVQGTCERELHFNTSCGVDWDRRC